MIFKYEIIVEAMKMLKLSYPELSKLSGVPESTLKKLTHGESEDPRLSTLYGVFKYLGLSIDRACGLAPERDIHKEAAEHNVSIAKALQERLIMQDDKIGTLKDTIAEQKAEIAAKDAKIEAKDKSIAHRDAIIKSKDMWIKTLIGVIIAMVIVFGLVCLIHGQVDLELVGK